MLIGNHDRHGRNIALIQTPKGYELSPFYDNVSYLGIEEESFLAAQHEPRGKIATRHTLEPTLKDYVQEFVELGYADIIKQFHKKINMPRILDMLDATLISRPRKKAFNALLNRRYLELEHALAN